MRRQLQLFSEPGRKAPRPHSPAQKLSELETLRVGVSVPKSIRDRLDEMVDAVDEEGDRDQVVAALVLSAPEDGRRLGEMIRDYRVAKASPSPRRSGERDRRRARRLREGGRRQRRYRG
jgi:hypothetical protein